MDTLPSPHKALILVLAGMDQGQAGPGPQDSAADPARVTVICSVPKGHTPYSSAFLISSHFHSVSKAESP